MQERVFRVLVNWLCQQKENHCTNYLFKLEIVKHVAFITSSRDRPPPVDISQIERRTPFAAELANNLAAPPLRTVAALLMDSSLRRCTAAQGCLVFS
jgi:hypothetical protein